MSSNRNHVTKLVHDKRVQYMREQYFKERPTHERLSDPEYATGMYRKRLEEFGSHDFRRAMQRRIASREREMKSEFFHSLRRNPSSYADVEPPKRYSEFEREHLRSSAQSLLRQAQGRSPVRRANSSGRRGQPLPSLPLRGRAKTRSGARKKKTSHNIHGQFEVSRPKDYKQKQEKLLATMARFAKRPQGTID